MYDRSPTAANRPLSEEDVNSLLEQPKTLAKEQDFLVQVLRRVLVTIRVREREVKDLRNAIDKMNEAHAVGNHPVEKGLAALRSLSDHDRDQVLSAYLAEKVALAEKAEQDALRAQTGARSELNRVRFALSQIAEDKSLEPASRDRIRNVLSALSGRTPTERVEEARVEAAAAVPPPVQQVRIPEGFLAPPRPTPAQAEDLSHLFDAPR